MCTLNFVSPLVNRFFDFNSDYWDGMTKPTSENCELLCSGMLMTGSLSVRKCYYNSIRLISPKQLKTFYYSLADKKFRKNRQLPAGKWMTVTLKKALGIIPPEAADLPIILIVDDTLVAKIGVHFFGLKKHHDHSGHRKANFLDGHCFVSFVALIPVKVEDDIVYAPVIIEQKMYTGEESKLIMARDMVRNAMETIGSTRSVLFLCDSWYPKGVVAELPYEFPNLEMVCNVRIDSAMYLLPTPPAEHTRGRRPTQGAQIAPCDFELTAVPGTNMSIGSDTVLAKLFGKKPVTATVTQKGKTGSNRLYYATNSSACEVFCRRPELLPTDEARQIIQADPRFAPYAVYMFRWAIETIFQQLKDSWDLCEYKVRSDGGINRLLNLQAIVFSTLSLLPAIDKRFAGLAKMSIQERRQYIGQLISREIFLRQLRQCPETDENSEVYKIVCRALLASDEIAA